MHEEVIWRDEPADAWRIDTVGLADIDDFVSQESFIETMFFIDGEGELAQPGKGWVTDEQDFFSVTVNKRREVENVLDDPVEGLSPIGEIVAVFVGTFLVALPPFLNDTEDGGQEFWLIGLDMGKDITFGKLGPGVVGWTF